MPLSEQEFQQALKQIKARKNAPVRNTQIAGRTANPIANKVLEELDAEKIKTEQPEQNQSFGSKALGFGKEVLRSAAQTGARFIFGTSGQSANQTPIERAGSELQAQASAPSLGITRTIGQYLPDEVDVPVLGKIKLRGETQKQEVGLMLQDLANAYGGEAVPAVKQGFKQAAYQSIEETSKIGGRAAFGSSLGSGLEEDKSTDDLIFDSIKSYAGGRLVGAGLGLGSSIAGTLLGKKIPQQKQIKNNDDLIKEADNIMNSKSTALPTEASGQLLETAEAQAPKVSLQEKWAGVRSDIKKQIQGKTDQLKTYFNISHARNLDTNLPTPYEFGATRVNKARDLIVEQLDDTGSEIGKIRTKLETYNIPNNEVTNIENTFKKELDKLGLQVDNLGKLKQKTGRPRQISGGDEKLLQELFDNIQTLKQTPKLENLIKNRIIFDSKINFGKTQREVSNAVDPLSRQLRNIMSTTEKKVVGKENTTFVQKYSDIITALEELNSYVDKRAGGEYLIRLVLSGRGREARELLNTINEHTGINLLDDAVMAQISTELIGNQAQKNLFRQEITNAGLDVDAILRGDKLGAVTTLLKRGYETKFPAEKVFLNATKVKK